MKTIKTLLLSTAVAAVVGASALGGAYAQTTPQAAAPTQTAPAPATAEPAPGKAVRGVLPRLICDASAAEQLESRFTQAATQLALTAEQQTLFNAYKAAALSAQTSFADACAKAQPQTAGTTAPDMLTVMKDRQAVRTAEVEAVNSVLPSFEAFFNGLSDAQKAQLAPQGRHGQNGPDGHGRGRMGQGHGPGGMQQGQGFGDNQRFRDGHGRGGNQGGFQGRGGHHHHGGGFGPNGPMQPGVPGQPPAPPAVPAPAAPAPAAPATAG